MPQNLMGVVRLTASPTTIVARILPLDNAELFNPCWTKIQLGTGTPPALEIVLVTRPALAPQNYTRIFLYPVAIPGGGGWYQKNKFPDPGNWNPSNNKVEAVGFGQSGWGAGLMPLAAEAPGPLIPPGIGSGLGGGGGGGGAYAHAENIPATFPVEYTVGFGGAVTTPGYLLTVWGADHFFPTAGPGVVYADGGTGGQYTSPGGGGSMFSPAGFPGGNAGSGSDGGGGGGGGAAGPAGAGGNGTAATSTTFGRGGYANAGSSAGGSTAGAPGVSGIEWGIAGCGAGGAGNITGVTNGVGGLYGGGGGGSDQSASPAGRLGGDGLIVITYLPLPSGLQAQILG